MKNLVTVILSFILFVSAKAINGFEAVSTTAQIRATTGPVVQNIVLDGHQQSFIVPHDGPYIISFIAHVLNPANTHAYVTIMPYVNNTDSLAAKTLQVPGFNQVMPIKFNGTLGFKRNDIITFKWISTKQEVSLQPVNNSPSFEVTIYPAKQKIE